MIKICQMCGNEFETDSNRAMYCPVCRKKRHIEKNNAYKQRKKEGLTREVGSTQLCPICGKEFVLKTGSQKCCGGCRHKQTNNVKFKYNSKYVKAHYDRLSLFLPKGERERVKAFAQSHGMSLNKLFMSALDEYMKDV